MTSERTSAPKLPVPTEHQSQKAVIQWWDAARSRWGLPRFSLFAIPNGGRGKNWVSGLIAEGLRPGTPDLFLAAQTKTHCGLFVEMKRKGKKPSPEQVEFLQWAATEDYATALCFSFDEAKVAIESYLQNR